MSIAPTNWPNLAGYNRVRWSDGRVGVFCMGHIEPQTFLFDVLPWMEGMVVNAPAVQDKDVRHVYFRVGPKSGRVYFCKPSDAGSFSASLWLVAAKYASSAEW